MLIRDFVILGVQFSQRTLLGSEAVVVLVWGVLSNEIC